MPTTLVGFVIFVALLTPGFLNYIQRRSLVPQAQLSPLVETATLSSVSLATNLVMLGLFGLTRTVFPNHTPDVRKLVITPKAYISARPGYILAWASALLLLSCATAVLWGRRTVLVKHMRASWPGSKTANIRLVRWLRGRKTLTRLRSSRILPRCQARTIDPGNSERIGVVSRVRGPTKSTGVCRL